MDSEKVEVYEVGWCYFNEHPAPQDKFEALLELLDATSDDPEDWIIYPEVREHHVKIGVSDYGRGPLEIGSPCGWAVYGQMKSDLGVHRIYEGQRIPVRER